ncbi:roadblock/LC7 domain-containing protein [Flavobacterium sp. J27]|uniref:roadblock/LC7 domain-containing protein n=1 Tax=Flavobacterium sp. J27 TaxID=2060419 RepID=UPI0010318F04|nr:roadblock/LC7 domain-containing protein [Flavobacterium sp. J27]
MIANMLQKLISETAIDAALLFDKKGTLIDSVNLDKPETLSAMTNIIVEMCQGLIEELDQKKLNQIILKSESLLIIANTTNEEQFLIAITSDITRLGLLIKVLENFVN